MSLSADINETIKHLFSPVRVKHEEIVKSKQRFAHYTAADTALKIIASGTLWMRDIKCMNDLFEVNHGNECLAQAYRGKHGKRFRELLNTISPEILPFLEEHFDRIINETNEGIYLTSFSIHENEDDLHGRLSMWRGYGDTAGVALVFRTDAFFNTTGILPALTSAVTYDDHTSFEKFLERTEALLASRIDLMKKISPTDLGSLLINLFYFTVLSSKHSAFLEEKEVRLIYPTVFGKSSVIEDEVVSIKGIPQIIQKIQLKKYHTDFDAGLPNILDRIIIGPTQYAEVQRRAFIRALLEAKVPDAEKKVHISNVPLRT